MEVHSLKLNVNGPNFCERELVLAAFVERIAK